MLIIYFLFFLIDLKVYKTINICEGDVKWLEIENIYSLLVETGICKHVQLETSAYLRELEKGEQIYN